MMAGFTAHRVRFVAAGLVFLLASACGGPEEGPEEAIRAWVEAGHKAAEAKDRSTMLDMISPAYADSRGNSREDIGNMMRFYFLRQDKVVLITHLDELEVFDDSAAELVLQVGMAGSNDNALGFSADAYRFEMELVRDGGDWLLIAARWGGLGNDVY
ncbi:MAG: hypothetical protein OET79_15095 [Nitrospirota bacterium]|nr:hypothetical protein [Nitrospirota bacterium]